MGGYDSTRERGTWGNYAWVLIQNHIPELLSLYITFYFDVECAKRKSFNFCKRVGVRSHIP